VIDSCHFELITDAAAAAVSRSLKTIA